MSAMCQREKGNLSGRVLLLLFPKFMSSCRVLKSVYCPTQMLGGNPWGVREKRSSNRGRKDISLFVLLVVVQSNPPKWESVKKLFYYVHNFVQTSGRRVDVPYRLCCLNFDLRMSMYISRIYCTSKNCFFSVVPFYVYRLYLSPPSTYCLPPPRKSTKNFLPAVPRSKRDDDADFAYLPSNPSSNIGGWEVQGMHKSKAR